MPLLHLTTINKDCTWGMWETTETVQELEAQLHHNVYDTQYLATVTHEGKKAESLAVRVLAKQLLQIWKLEYKGIIKDSYDKPYLAGYSFHLSISHTTHYAAVIIHKHQQVGIDIEFVKEKLLKVAPKFLSETELHDAGNHLQKLCVYWSAKEVMYKKYGMKQLSLKDEISVQPFKLGYKGKLKGTVEKADYYLQSEIIYMIINNLIISYSFE